MKASALLTAMSSVNSTTAANHMRNISKPIKVITEETKIESVSESIVLSMEPTIIVDVNKTTKLSSKAPNKITLENDYGIYASN